MMIKRTLLLLLIIIGSLHAMEKQTGRPIFAPASIITPAQEAELEKLPEQERTYKLRDFMVHNILQESDTLDQAIDKIKKLARESAYKNVLAFDVDYIRRYGSIEWLAQQRNAGLDAVIFFRLTPGKESYLNIIGESRSLDEAVKKIKELAQEKSFKLRDLTVHNILQESDTLDAAIDKIKKLARESVYKNVLAFDVDYIRRYGSIEWLAQQRNAGLDAVIFFRLTPGKESYINCLPADMRCALLRNYIIHNIIGESRTLDEAVKKIRELAQEKSFASLLAADTALLEEAGPIGWLAKQDVDYVMKYYVPFMRQGFKTAEGKRLRGLEDRMPDLARLIKIISLLHHADIIDAIKAIIESAQSSGMGPIINSYPMTEYLLDLFARKEDNEPVLVAAQLQTPGAAKYIEKKGWPALNIITVNLRYLINSIGEEVGRLLFLVQSLPNITDNASQMIASRIMLAAIENNDEQTVKALLAKGFNPNTQFDKDFIYYNDYYSMPLMQAIIRKNTEVVKLLLEAGADSNQSASFRSTKDARFSSVYPLIYASENGLTDIVKLILENRFAQQIQKLRAEQGAQSYLGLLPSELITSAVAYINADPNITDNWGHTALYWAVSGNHSEIVALLLQAGASVNNQDVSGRTALMEAARIGNLAMMQRLIRAGADRALQDNKGKTALDYAVEGTRPMISEYLKSILKPSQPS